MIARLLSPLGRIVLGAALVTVALAAAYLEGSASAKRRCAEQALTRRLAATEAELAAQRDAALAAAREVDALERHLTQARQEIRTYAKQLEARGRLHACRLDADDIRRLRAIR
jgi:septal ring factor EnvC (AmiA/AmiB activator)